MAIPWVAQAQPAGARRIGWVMVGTAETNRDFIASVDAALGTRGLVLGRDFVNEVAAGEGQRDALQDATDHMVATRPALIVALGTPGTQAATRATSSIPIVMVAVADPVTMRFVASLARPGGNVTGITNMALETVAKPVELLHQVAPRATRLALIAPENPAMQAVIDRVQRDSAQLGFTTSTWMVDSVQAIEVAMAEIARQRMDALFVVADRVTILNRRRICELAAQMRVPAAYQYAMYVEAGGLMSFGPDPRLLPDIVADYIARILAGARPADLPVQQPSEFEMVLNRSAARALGLTFPPAMLARANRVVD